MKKQITFIIAITVLIVGSFLGFYFVNKTTESNNKYLVEINFKDFKNKIENKDSFILFIKQTGCNHCERFEPILKRVVNDYQVTAYMINLSNLKTDEKAYLKNIAKIEGTPTTVFIVNGEEETTINRLGNVDRDTVISRLKSLGYIK